MIKVRLGRPASPHQYPFDLEATARWALSQAAHGWPHCISRLDVLARAAELALQQSMPALFVDGNGGEFKPADVVAMLERGDDPRPARDG